MKVVCGCCEPRAGATPIEVENRPGLSAVAYRVGTYASFRQTMTHAIAAHRELDGLTTRESDDYAITFIDLWAAVADVLTFYQERYANEAFLRTARFRDSVARLAALLDYRLRPGIAARTWLAFSVESGKALAIAAGQQVQSVPAAGEEPQVFETLEELAADARWNRLRIWPAPTSIAALSLGAHQVDLDRLGGPAVAANLAPDDRVVIFNDGSSVDVEEKKIAAIQREDDRVLLRWDEPIHRTTWHYASTRAFRYRRTLRVFGRNAPAKYMEPHEVSGRIEWDLNTTSYTLAAGSSLELDGRYDDLTVGARLLVGTGSGVKRLVTIEAIEEATATVGPTSGAVTRLTLTPGHSGGDLRELRVWELLDDEITFWGGTYPAQLTGTLVHIAGVAVEDGLLGPGVEIGRKAGRDAFEPGVAIYLKEVEVGRVVLVEDASGKNEAVRATLKSAPALHPPTAVAGQFCHLVLELDADEPLAHDAATAVLVANVAEASHGATVAREVLGGGDASEPFLRLPLAKKALTHLPAATGAGVESTLEVRVNDVRWSEVPGLYGRNHDEHVYELRHDDEGVTTVQFGDGVMGAKPPTGSGNIVASYRHGSGLAGRVRKRSLTTLLAKPTGLEEATNPLAAEGGADAESLEDARENAPRTVRTFGRAVSLRDFEDIVTESGEVAKAHATWVWDGLDRAVHLTIAGQDGGTFSADARRDMGLALDRARDPNHRMSIDNYTRVFVELEAGIAVDPDHDEDAVIAAAHDAVVAALSFERLRLGQSLHLSDVYRILQDVDGVVFVDIDKFQFKAPSGFTFLQFLIFLFRRGATLAPVQPHLRVFSARPDPTQPGHVLAAELAALDSPTQDVTIQSREV